jgi:hypothetical protein
MERQTTGEFVRPDGVSSGKVELHISETTRRPDEPGVSDLHGWAPNISWKFAAPILVGDMKCDLLFEGRHLAVLVQGKDVDGELTLRFERM